MNEYRVIPAMPEYQPYEHEGILDPLLGSRKARDVQYDHPITPCMLRQGNIVRRKCSGRPEANREYDSSACESG